MITCPECGEQASDDAKFCDRCGQGLGSGGSKPPAARLTPLPDGTALGNGYRIVGLLSQSSLENRYRAEFTHDDKVEQCQLREREGAAGINQPEYQQSEAEEKPAAEEDPAGPHAKTAELKLKDLHAKHDAPGASGQGEMATGEINATEASAADSGADDAIAENAATETADNPQAQANSDQNNTDGEVSGAPPAVEIADGKIGGIGVESLAGESSVATEAEANKGPAIFDDLGEVFGRVLALSLTLNHPALQRAFAGFSSNGRVYLAYPDEEFVALSQRMQGKPLREADALNIAIQVCQAVSFIHRRGLRLNDICPDSVGFGRDGRVKLTGLEYISNDNELQAEPIFNDGYTAPEIYRSRNIDKRADIFSIAALLYTCLTAARLDAETWVEEAGPIRFYPPHVVSPELEQAIRRALAFNPAQRWPNVDAFKAELVRLNSIVRPRAAVLTDVGMVREHNEDAVMAAEYLRDSLVEPAQNFLYVVADGMGGAEAGEVASAIAVSAIRSYVAEKLSSPVTDMGELLRGAIEHANSKIIEYQTAHPESRGMGSTAVSALIIPPEAVIAWVGDSRAYLCDNVGLRQLTKDHSLVQRLIEIGQITAEQARHHEHKNVITRSLGARQTGPAGAESVAVRLKRGDRLMLCSDGLTTHVEDREIGTVLRRHSDPYEAARELVVAANAGGGTDNVSVVVIYAV
jgi:serine/threonine protein phosphatase PrpC